MCLATVYLTHDGEDEQVCSSITHMDKNDDELIFTDLLGRRTSVFGSIYEMDFNGSKIYIHGTLAKDSATATV